MFGKATWAQAHIAGGKNNEIFSTSQRLRLLRPFLFWYYGPAFECRAALWRSVINDNIRALAWHGVNLGDIFRLPKGALTL